MTENNLKVTEQKVINLLWNHEKFGQASAQIVDGVLTEFQLYDDDEMKVDIVEESPTNKEYIEALSKYTKDLLFYLNNSLNNTPVLKEKFDINEKHNNPEVQENIMNDNINTEAIVNDTDDLPF